MPKTLNFKKKNCLSKEMSWNYDSHYIKCERI